MPLATTYGYDATGLQQLTYPTGLTVQFDRDPASRLVTGVRNVATGTAYASSITRTPGGAISSLAYPNGRTLAQTFTLRGEPLTIHDGPVWLSAGAQSGSATTPEAIWSPAVIRTSPSPRPTTAWTAC